MLESNQLRGRLPAFDKPPPQSGALSLPELPEECRLTSAGDSAAWRPRIIWRIPPLNASLASKAVRPRGTRPRRPFTAMLPVLIAHVPSPWGERFALMRAARSLESPTGARRAADGAAYRGLPTRVPGTEAPPLAVALWAVGICGLPHGLQDVAPEQVLPPAPPSPPHEDDFCVCHRAPAVPQEQEQTSLQRDNESRLEGSGASHEQRSQFRARSLPRGRLALLRSESEAAPSYVPEPGAALRPERFALGSGFHAVRRRPACPRFFRKWIAARCVCSTWPATCRCGSTVWRGSSSSGLTTRTCWTGSPSGAPACAASRSCRRRASGAGRLARRSRKR
ncbi:hypothetical protein DFJ74DRAFT_376233 [Hyaloraphidium curvatum]|nr:hypothetical protein DFJ74DRAFT_376233 [Hyaloraphidium curvatum]